MPRILIAGCGYVGEATADFFRARGWLVEGWTASPESAAKLSHKPYPVRAVDIADLAAISAAAGEFDVIIQCASSGGGGTEEYRKIYLDGSRNLVRTFPKATLLFTSSTSVYAQKDRAIVDETSPAEPTHERGLLLREAEEVVLANGGMAARIGGIYGPGRSFLLRKFLSGEHFTEEKEQRFINQVHRDDIVAALFLLAERRADSRGEIYNVVDDEPTTRGEVYAWLGSQMRQPMRVGEEKLAPRRSGESNKRVSNRKLRAFGWELRYPNFRIGMAESVIPSFELAR